MDGEQLGTPPSPLLTVVVPVYNGGEEIVENVGVIRRRIAAGLAGEALEVIVVSDGSIDDTAERLLGARADAGIRVIHYDRNLGKGYAVKAGALAAHGEWVALVDADLDLDPASIPEYLAIARREGLDFAIGSKRHPASVVHYPRSRLVASWCYQQLNRALFGLHVRDTQVGLKVFSRDVVREVMPLLLVKQFAFDLELLAVASALGHDRVRELPVRLDYRFTGSALGSAAVARALWDTAAVFYRLRLLRTYQRKRRLFGTAQPAAAELLPRVTLVGDAAAVRLLDYPSLDVSGEVAAGAPRAGSGEILAILAPDTRPAGNWVSASVPYLLADDVAAVVCPTLVPQDVPLAQRVAAAVLESKVGGGSRRMRYLPGNVRVVSDHSVESVVVRRDEYREAVAADVPGDRLVAWLAARGKRTVYTPDTSVSAAPPPLVRPHLRATVAHARTRGAVARASRGTSSSLSTAASVGPAAGALAGTLLLLAGGQPRKAGAALVGLYAGALAVSGVHAAVRFRSPVVGLLQPPAAVVTHAAYLYGFVRGLAERRSGRS